METAYTAFDTAIGNCAIAWRKQRVVGFALAGSHAGEAARSLGKRCPDARHRAAPEPVERAIAAVCRLLAGEPADLRFVDVDLDRASLFERTTYAALRAVGPGTTITYGELAARIGSPGAARAVGVAMARNPVPVIIPCHRVLAGNGRSGGFSAPGGVTTKFRLLQIEQAGRAGGTMLFDDLPLAVAPVDADLMR